MKYLQFIIKKFKGIETVDLRLDKAPIGSVHTLVGLNESGKTTILEALSYFESKDRGLESLYEPVFRQGDVHDLIPMKSKGNFNGSVEICAAIGLSQEDREDIEEFASDEYNFKVNTDALGDKFTVTKQFGFIKSEYQKTQNHWAINIEGIPFRHRKQRSFADHDFESWKELIAHIEMNIPSILYFPTFLFEFPSRIYLQAESDESATAAFYRGIVQEILDSLEDGLDIESHIVERAINGGSIQRRSLVSILNKMGNAVTRTVFERWNEVFDRKVAHKDIVISHGIEEIKNGETIVKRVYLEFMIKDGDSLYLITERSLGFRWFFCFLLFTQFRQHRKSRSNALFLFDEPASNLHSRAQMQLLRSFAKITENASAIVYSTHSHHMINPRWLENTHIVVNEGLRYDESDGDYLYSSRDTNILIERYRTFVDKNPSRLTYFQPILDTLDYLPSSLENIPEAVFMEGKDDFYMMRYFGEVVLRLSTIPRIIPGTGASGLDSIIALYLGWGRRFIVVLDDDDEGRKCKERYIDEWLLPKNCVFTLSDVNEDWTGYRTETLITDEDLSKIREAFYPGSNGRPLKKKQVTRAIQELFSRGDSFAFSAESQERFRSLLSFCVESVANV